MKEIVLKTIRSVDPYKITKEKCTVRPGKKNFLVAFGKASLGMAKAISEVFEISAGVVSTNEDTLPENGKIEYFQGGHPFPNRESVKAAKRAIEIIRSATDEDLVIFAISGGGSALFEYPKVDLEILNEITKQLMRSGADIYELNTVRKALSYVKGGKMSGFTKARIVSFVISDVVGDDLSTIASGPTYPQSVNTEDAIAIMEKYKIKVPSFQKDDVVPRKDVDHVIIASNKDACENARRFLKDAGYDSFYLGSSIQGEAREVARVLGGIYTEIERGSSDLKKPVAIISGGETTVNVKGNGLGGRNQEMALAMVEITKDKKITFASFGTDGIDGNSPADGAIVDGKTFEMAKSFNLDPKEFLSRNDSFNFFDKINLSIVTGPTGTNVMDIQIAIVE
ncbi:glycerate kinase type-2 family protein [Athalassotoga saccharophila]|uniref:glycerate kinase type-2 family protein n=1 Tax=Athalassotoga saccharophila TaxID=1441386 RepID=UPI00137A7B6E|nr:glycerate kinase [Athalassotoga saccharophila]BBJ27389.1 D-glycerate 2-kinase [Athalassotoga saccharophila]